MGKSSCCCGATPSKPCLCMKQDVMSCSAKAPMCPCYKALAEKKGAESFNAETNMWEADYTKGYTDTTQKIEYEDNYGKPKEVIVQGLSGYAGNCPSCSKRINFPIDSSGLYCYDCQVYLRPSKGTGMDKTLQYDAETFGVDVIHRKDGIEVGDNSIANEYQCGECDSVYDNSSDATICCKCSSCDEPIHEGYCIKNAETYEAKVYDSMMQKKIDQNECTHLYGDGNDAWNLLYSDIDRNEFSYVYATVKCEICAQERYGSWGVFEDSFEIVKGKEGRMPKMYGFYGAEYHRDSKGRFAEKPILTGSVIGGLALGLMYFMGRK